MISKGGVVHGVGVASTGYPSGGDVCSIAITTIGHLDGGIACGVAVTTMNHPHVDREDIVRQVGIAISGAGTVNAIAVLVIMGTHGGRSRSREGAPYGSCRAHRGITRCDAIGGKAVAAMDHPKVGREGIIRRVVDAVGVTYWVDRFTILGILVADKARSGHRQGAAHGWPGGCNLSAKGDGIYGITVAALANPQGRNVGIVRRVETAIGVTRRESTAAI